MSRVTSRAVGLLAAHLFSCAHTTAPGERGETRFTPSPPLVDGTHLDATWRQPFATTARGRANPWVDLARMDPTLEARTRPWVATRRPALRSESPESVMDAVFELGIGDPRGLRFGWIECGRGCVPLGWASANPATRLVLRWDGSWSATDEIIRERDGMSAARRHLEVADRTCDPSPTDDHGPCDPLRAVMALRSLGADSIEWLRHRDQFVADALLPAVIDARLRSLFAAIANHVARGDDVEAVRSVRAVDALLRVTSPTAVVAQRELDAAREWAAFALDRATARDARRAPSPDETPKQRVLRLLTEAIDCRREREGDAPDCEPLAELSRIKRAALPFLVAAIENDQRVCRACAHDALGRPPRLAAAAAEIAAQRIGAWLGSLREEATWDRAYRVRVSNMLRAYRPPPPFRPARRVRLRAIDVIPPITR
ncbi:MAG: hypothetical protein JNK05_10280 [Myxococcales bacterium]|nr:hypothetical protein [Myxococcales bacterium]